MGQRLRGRGRAKVPAELCEIAMGRTELGVPYALVVIGSEVVATAVGFTLGGALTRARRKAHRFTGGDVRVSW